MRKRRERTPPETRLEQFLRHHNILPVELARASGCSRAGLSKTRYGRKDVSRRQMAAILAGARLIVPNAAVTITDLFSFDDGVLPAARKDWHRVPRPGRPPRRK